ncbi:hypothetical protein [Streptomyces sp. BP-8]|uniref:Uncharacterized protein n=1 Tax=Streptomyces sirii TaxID=3127701 RepID=A0ABZ2QRV4_9ACTN
MTIAALPDLNNTTDPRRLKLFHGYRHLITPLRHNGWRTDVELSRGEPHLRAELGDGTELITTSVNGLPDDPNEATGWSVVRLDTEDQTRHAILYDSTPDGPQSHHGNRLITLFHRLGAMQAPKSTERLVVSTTYTALYSGYHHQNTGSETPGEAIARFFECSGWLVANDGYQQVWERPESEGYPLAIFEKDGHITTVRVMPSYD